MRLPDIYKNNKLSLSFEVFPPKGEGNDYIEKVNALFGELNILKKYNPALISVTYGAGGSTCEKTFDLVLKIKKELHIEPMSHFTCVSFDKIQIAKYVKNLENAGITNILALRGDPPKNTDKFIPPENGFAHANELVEFLHSTTDLSIAVAGYPEKHPEAVNFNSDIDFLKKKTDAGADVIFTQLFFNNEHFYKFYECALAKNISVPVIPGIMPIQSISQIDRIITLSGSDIPKALAAKIEKYKDNPEEIKKTGNDFAIQQVSELIDFGVKGVHFYPLNKAYAVNEILKSILPA